MTSSATCAHWSRRTRRGPAAVDRLHGERGVGRNDITNAAQTERREPLGNRECHGIRGFVHRRSELDKECGISERQDLHGPGSL